MSRSTPIEQIPMEQHNVKPQVTNEADVTVQQMQQTPVFSQQTQSNYDDIHELQRELAFIKKQNELMQIQNSQNSHHPEYTHHPEYIKNNNNNLDTNNVNQSLLNVHQKTYSFINFCLTETDIKQILLLSCCYYISGLQATKLFFQRILEFIPNENIITVVHCVFFSVIFVVFNKVFI